MNEIHADPLTWTAPRPVVTNRLFPEYTTGVQIFWNVEMKDVVFAYTLYTQDNASVDETPVYRKSASIHGGRVRWLGGDGMEIGIPFLYYVDRQTDNRVFLTGLDLYYDSPIFDLRGESTYSSVEHKNGGQSQEYGYYIQGVYTLDEKNFIVLMHEYMKTIDSKDYRALTFGGVYKLKPQIVFKADYQIRNGSLDGAPVSDRLMASFSVLF